MRVLLEYIFLKYINVLLIAAALCFGFFIFYEALSHETGDYISHYLLWFNHVKSLGILQSISTHYTDYPYGFDLLFAIFSHIPLDSLHITGYKPLWNIKIMIYCFYILIPISSYFIVKHCTNDKYHCAKAFFITSISPTVIMNASVWGQVDCVWVSMLLIAINFLIRGKYVLFFTFVGIALSLKQTAILILPFVFLIILRKKDIKVSHVLFAVISFLLLSLPSALVIRTFNILGPYNGYGRDITGVLVANFSNIFALFTPSPHWASWFSDGMYTNIFLVICIGILLILIVDLNRKNIELNSSNSILLITMFFVVICNFLPGIHDRYMLFADVTSIIYAIISSKKLKDIWIPIFINFVSIFNYINYLKGIAFELSNARIVMVQLVSIGFFAFSIYLLYYTFKELESKSISI